ncbi:MAG: hypothetical protein AAAFM81_12390 [Pseudomonadota bacterium]
MRVVTHSARSTLESQTNFRLLSAVCLVGTLPVAFVARLSGWRWQPWPPGRSGYRSVIREALIAAKTAAAIALSA